MNLADFGDLAWIWVVNLVDFGDLAWIWVVNCYRFANPAEAACGLEAWMSGGLEAWRLGFGGLCFESDSRCMCKM